MRKIKQSKKINKSPVFEITSLINKQFKTLGNIVADYLVFSELLSISADKEQCYKEQVKKLIDEYAEQFDKVLAQQKVDLSNTIEGLAGFMLDDLKKINSHREFTVITV